LKIIKTNIKTINSHFSMYEHTTSTFSELH